MMTVFLWILLSELMIRGRSWSNEATSGRGKAGYGFFIPSLAGKRLRSHRGWSYAGGGSGKYAMESGQGCTPIRGERKKGKKKRRRRRIAKQLFHKWAAAQNKNWNWALIHLNLTESNSIFIFLSHVLHPNFRSKVMSSQRIHFSLSHFSFFVK